MTSPDYSVVIPALNEGDLIGATVAAARRAFGGRAEYLVVDGGSRDGTAEAAAAEGARLVQAPPGRGAQLRAGVEAARGHTLVLLHADTLLPAEAAAALDAALADPVVVGGAFRLRFDPGAGRLPLALRLLAAAINLRSRLLRTATGDQGIFARAQAMRRAGGVPAVPLFEDIQLYRALRRIGRVRLLRPAVSTSPRLWLRYGTGRTILLHLALRLAHALGAPPTSLARVYPKIRDAAP